MELKAENFESRKGLRMTLDSITEKITTKYPALRVGMRKLSSTSATEG